LPDWVEQPPRTPTPRISHTTEFITLVTVPKGAEGFIDVTTLIIELMSDAPGETTGSCETIDSTAETIGVISGRPLPGAFRAELASPRALDTTLLMTEMMVGAGASVTIDST